MNGSQKTPVQSTVHVLAHTIATIMVIPVTAHSGTVGVTTLRQPTKKMTATISRALTTPIAAVTQLTMVPHRPFLVVLATARWGQEVVLARQQAPCSPLTSLASLNHPASHTRVCHPRTRCHHDPHRLHAARQGALTAVVQMTQTVETVRVTDATSLLVDLALISNTTNLHHHRLQCVRAVMPRIQLIRLQILDAARRA